VKQLEIVEGGDNGLGAKVKIAMIFIEQKKYDLAISRLKSILREVPESDKIKFYLAAVYEEINEAENAIEIYKQIPLASNYYTDAVLHGVYLLKVKERYDEALSWNKDALKKRPDVIQFYTMYASLLDDKKQYADALDFLKKSEKDFPEDEQIQFFLGSFFDKLGDRKEAIARMQKVLSINADHSQAMNFIAYTYAEMGENLDEALHMATRAIELKPEDPFYLDTLGWVHFKSGKTDKSIQYLEAAYKLAPGESIIAQHLGDAYYRYQLLLKAKLFYKKAIETEQDNEEKRKIQQKLASTESALSNASAKNIPRTTPEARKPASDD
ncbi:MAG: tetratricopeptide repeat protein, partial [Bdellovibrionales bacterium]|nr:tetratricopeptide repeat protein [Bdellovibrionales bacterium]